MGIDETSLERIRTARFPTSWAWRGYDKIEVEKFLDSLADWLEQGGVEDDGGGRARRRGARSDSVKRLEAKVKKLEREAAKAADRETELTAALKEARGKREGQRAKTSGAPRRQRSRRETSSEADKPVTKRSRAPTARSAKKQTTASRRKKPATRAKKRATGSHKQASATRARKPATGSQKGVSAGTARASGRELDINEVSFEELRALGLSITQSARLVAIRETRGTLKSVDVLDELKDVPRATMEKLKRRLVLRDSEGTS